MGVLYMAVCDSKREYISGEKVTWSSKSGGFVRGQLGRIVLAASITRWAGLQLRVIGDSGEEFMRVEDEYADVTLEVSEEWHHDLTPFGPFGSDSENS